MDKIAKKINIITLGCSKNIVDSEQFAAQAVSRGFKVVHNSNKYNFDIAFVNTCGFINDAKEESINTILELVNAKNNKKLKKIVVFGCLAQRYFNELKKEIPEVDILLGNYNLTKLLDSLDVLEQAENKFERVFDSPGHFAYLKIAEGCNRNCSFCAIPLFKGKYISREFSDIIAEAKHLAKMGVKELLIIAQDVSYYGYDLKKEFLLPELVEELSKIKGIEWIRLHYLYPFLFPDKLIDVIANNPKVCKYIDIPLQHITDNMLTAMNRGGTKMQTVELMNKIREKIPEMVIRTTMLVGHPSETQEDFIELVEFIKEQKFDRLGVFTYSEEEGTNSAKRFKDEISDEIKTERSDILMEIQREISNELNSKKLGKEYKVIIDRIEGENYIGRTEYDSVEVDNEVIISSAKKMKIGEFYNVKIVGFDDYELYGEKS
jgi:ribosomal protein S12 methylthiotransferase